MLKPYTNPVLYDAGGDIDKKWYVEYKYLNPATDKWERFRAYQGLNKYKVKKDRREYASTIINSLLKVLREGYNPFAVDIEQDLGVNVSMEVGVDRFLKLKMSHIRPKTLSGYRSVLKQALEHFKRKGRAHRLVAQVTSADIQEYLDWAKTSRTHYANTTHNTELTTLRVFFEFWRERGHCTINPARPIKRLRENPVQHQAYSDAQLETVTSFLRASATPQHKQLLQFIQFVYYACVRPKELRALRVKDINLIERTVVIPGALAKSGRTESITISDGLMAVIEEMNLVDLPAHYYLFGNAAKGVTGDYFVPGPGPKSVGVNHFSDLFRQVMRELKLPDTATIYGFKHTRNIHLYKDGVDLYRIMRHNRHTSLDITQKYLRNLGLFMDTTITDTRKL